MVTYAGAISNYLTDATSLPVRWILADAFVKFKSTFSNLILKVYSYCMGSATGRAGGHCPPPPILKNNSIMHLAPLNFRSNIYSSGSRGNRVNVPPNTNILELREWESIVLCRNNFNFSLNFSQFLLKFS